MTLGDTAGSGQASDNETRLDWENAAQRHLANVGRVRVSESRFPLSVSVRCCKRRRLEDPFAETRHRTVRRGHLDAIHGSPITGGDNNDTLLQVGMPGKKRRDTREKVLASNARA